MDTAKLAYRGLRACAVVSVLALPACVNGTVGRQADGVFAPGVDNSFLSRAKSQDGIEVGHRLIAAGEYELALRAFSRVALDRGATDPEILLGMGTANLGLGRLNQSERLLRLAIKKEGNWPELWNNLGVVLMEQGKTAEAGQIFRKAYALDNGQSDSVRDNLRLALSKTENSVTTDDNNNDYKLVRRGTSDYLIRSTTS